MLNKVSENLRRFSMVAPGDRVICAVSGGADSMALLWSMVLLREKLGITLEAAHFNHNLRGEESQRDEAFVRDFCAGYGIPLHVGSGSVVSGKKGLEAAARDARYAFLRSLGGIIATAHTADDNAETMLLHLIRGTGLKGLGAIAPKASGLIRPMLTVTREEVLAFLAEYAVPHVEDSSNASDDFLRNRVRHSVMPLLKQENPSLSENLSETALRLRQDEEALRLAADRVPPEVSALRQAAPALRRRVLETFLKNAGVREPEASHIRQLEALVWTDKPSAASDFPGGVKIGRQYDRLAVLEAPNVWEPVILPCPGEVSIPEAGFTVRCTPGRPETQSPFCFAVQPVGDLVLRQRQTGDRITLPGGTKSLKKLLIDRKIPAAERSRVIVAADDDGIVGVCGIGPDLRRQAEQGSFTLCFQPLSAE